MKILVILLLLVAAFAIYVRRSSVTLPSFQGDFTQDTTLVGGFVAVRKVQSDPTARLTQIALATPRTTQIGTDPLTFVTRSAVVGFPDVTQIVFDDGVLTIHAHLVFGKSDLGVNKKRVLSWLAQADLLTQPE